MITELSSRECHGVLQVLAGDVRISDGFGKTLLVSSQDTGKKIAISAFESRERQFVSGVVVVDSVSGDFCRCRFSSETTGKRKENQNATQGNR